MRTRNPPLNKKKHHTPPSLTRRTRVIGEGLSSVTRKEALVLRAEKDREEEGFVANNGGSRRERGARRYLKSPSKPKRHRAAGSSQPRVTGSQGTCGSVGPTQGDAGPLRLHRVALWAPQEASRKPAGSPSLLRPFLSLAPAPWVGRERSGVRSTPTSRGWGWGRGRRDTTDSRCLLSQSVPEDAPEPPL